MLSGQAGRHALQTPRLPGNLFFFFFFVPFVSKRASPMEDNTPTMSCHYFIYIREITLVPLHWPDRRFETHGVRSGVCLIEVGAAPEGAGGCYFGRHVAISLSFQIPLSDDL
jgi:hypothetical protein